MSNRYFILLCTTLLLATTALLSCGKQTTFIEYESLTAAEWRCTDIKTFDTIPITVPGTYAIDLLLRTDQRYPFKDLTVIVRQTLSSSQETTTDTIACPIFNNRGRATGNGISLFQHTFPLNKRYLTKGDTLSISLQHFMQQDILPGIADVGVRVKKE